MEELSAHLAEEKGIPREEVTRETDGDILDLIPAHKRK